MRLVTYAWLTVVVAVACAAIGWIGLAGWMAAVVAMASVAMHVAGNAIGTRMRETADHGLLWRDTTQPMLPSLPVMNPGRLERRESLGYLVPVSSGIGATVGGVAGTTALVLLTGCSPAGAVLGGGSSAVIGGLFGFLIASLVEILRTSLGDAIAAERPVPPSVPSHSR
ncbi:MAG: hypothetical protein ACKOEX_02765 [Planctomycetia bacterium]